MMTDSQKLLAEYAESGSETAFRELVARYVDFVYSAAVRLMQGDTHLAEDVAQTVFADLASRASRLSSGIMLGGWLHRHTCYVAAHFRRSERRRRIRERQAAEMTSLSEHSETNLARLARLAPILDEAINQLRTEDRLAILLRFFEQRDFRSIGLALGSNEDAAQKRVTRALDKLHAILKRRGVTISAVALGSALAGKTVWAAPAGLAAHISSTVLAGTTAAGFTSTFIKIMTMTKLKTALVSSVLVTSVAASLIVQQQARARMRAGDETMRRQSDQLRQLTSANQQLSNQMAQADGQKNEWKDLLRLRNQIDALRARTNQLAALQLENRLLRTTRPDGKPKTPLELIEETMDKVDFAKYWLLSFRIYAGDHQNMFPTNYSEALSIYSGGPTNVSTNVFDLVYQGSCTATNLGDIIAMREKESALDEHGKWVKVYGMADGSVQILGLPIQWGKHRYNSFHAFERAHIVAPSGQ